MNDLRRLTNTILDTSATPIALQEALDELKDLLLSLTGIKGEGADHRNNINTEAGLAIGTEWAARCLDDTFRSVKFIRGVHQAISDRLSLEPGRPVELLYAGTGPFATLVFPLLAWYKPEQLQLTLVEINDMSITALKRLFALSEYSGFVRTILHADCTKLELPNWETIDILLSETMQYALQREHQVPITQYLISKLRSDVVLIPQEINVGLAALSHLGGEGDWKLIPLSPLLTLSTAGFTSPVTTDGKTGTAEYPHELFLPARPEIGGVLVLTTDIHVYGTEHLGFNESGLTIAESIDVDGGGDTDRIFTWHYGYTPEPGIVWKWKPVANP
jgi:hypothetical protein